LSWGILDPGCSISDGLERLCSVVPMVAAVDSVGAGRVTAGTAITNVPCSLQPASANSRNTYKAENSEDIYDLFLPLRLEGSATNLPVPVATRFVVDGVTYRALGSAVRQGQSGVQRVAVTEVNP
jgi:hypothetical protein